VLELLREGDSAYLVVIAEPSDLVLLKVYAHPYHWLIFEPQFSRTDGLVSSAIAVSPQSQSCEVLTVHVGIMLDEAIAQAHKHILANSLYLNLEVDLSFLPDAVLAVYDDKISR
jgi:hypothetical protein